MMIIKLGGSVITDKKATCSFDDGATTRLSREIYESGKKCIIVHGAGSFGHPLAKKYRLDEGNGDIDGSKLEGFSQTHSSVRKLNLKVMECLRNAGIPAVSIPPLSIIRCSNGKIEKFDWMIFKKILEIGLTPVTFGDVVLDSQRKFCICSGDLLIGELAKKLNANKVIFATDVDGIYLENKKIIEKATAEELEGIEVRGSTAVDVTSGMSGKVEVIKDISRMGIEVCVINGRKAGRLYNAMRDKVLGTKIYG